MDNFNWIDFLISVGAMLLGYRLGWQDGEKDLSKIKERFYSAGYSNATLPNKITTAEQWEELTKKLPRDGESD